jgi:Domain of unknown function (DUF1990)
VKLNNLAALPLTYPEVGATAGPLPAGYHHVQKSAVIGRGRRRFDDAAAKGMQWGMLRGAGLRVEATTELAAVGSEVIVHLGPVRAPCRVVYVVDPTNADSPMGHCRATPNRVRNVSSSVMLQRPTRCLRKLSRSRGTPRGGAGLAYLSRQWLSESSPSAICGPCRTTAFCVNVQEQRVI